MISKRDVIFRIDKYPQNQFRFTLPCQFLFIYQFFFYVTKGLSKNNTLTDVSTLNIFISPYVKRETPFMGLIDTRHNLQISRKVYMYKYVIVSTDSSFNQFKTSRMYLGRFKC